MDMGPAHWDSQKSDKNMLLAGWCGRPRKIPGLLDEQVQMAMDRCDVDLQQVNFKQTRQSSSGDGQEGDEISAHALLSRIIYRTFGASVFDDSSFLRTTFLGQLLLALVPVVTRASYGYRPFGESWQAELITSCMFVMVCVGGQFSYMLLLVSAFDFRRRLDASAMLTKLTTLPGCTEEEFFENVGRTSRGGIVDLGEREETAEESGLDKMMVGDTLYREYLQFADGGDDDEGSGGKKPVSSRLLGGNCDMLHNERIYFDLRDPDNAFAWMLTRRVLRKVGEKYFERCQIFTAFYLAFTFASAALLNSLYWTSQAHFISGATFVIAQGFWLLVGFCYASYVAAKLQDLAGKDRLMLRRETFLIDKEIIDVDNEIREINQRCSKTYKGQADALEEKELRAYIDLLKNSKNFLVSGEKLVDIEECDLEPVEVLGMRADIAIISSILGLFATVLLFAYEGYNNSSHAYENGWFVLKEED